MEYNLKISNIKAAIQLGLITPMEASVIFKECVREYVEELKL